MCVHMFCLALLFERGYSFVARLIIFPLTTTSLSTRSTVTTPDRDTSNAAGRGRGDYEITYRTP